MTTLTSLVDNHWPTAGLQVNPSFLKAGNGSNPLFLLKEIQYCQAHLLLAVVVAFTNIADQIITTETHIAIHSNLIGRAVPHLNLGPKISNGSATNNMQ